MPPDGKPQLSESQLSVLRWWLDAGAPTDKTVGELKPTEEIIEACLNATPTPNPPRPRRRPRPRNAPDNPRTRTRTISEIGLANAC
jgi:hypothetical protein